MKSMMAFYDRGPIEHNSIDGIFYTASGLVETINPPCESGKEILTVHVDPHGDVRWEWRAASEIVMYEIGESQFDLAMHNINQLEELRGKE